RKLTVNSGPPTAVVTGAAGFIGSHLTMRLVEQGWAVRGLDNERSGDWERLKVPVERVARNLASLTDDELTSLCDGAGALFHLAAETHNSSKTTPQRTIEVNVLATQRRFDAAVRSWILMVLLPPSL